MKFSEKLLGNLREVGVDGAKPDSLNKTPVEFFRPGENRKELFQSQILELLQK